MDFLGGVLGDRGEARVDVLHHTVAIDQQERVGALFHGALEQVQGAGGGASVVVVDDLGELVRQLAGKSDFIRLPGAGDAHLLQAQHAHHLAVDTHAGVENGIDVTGAQALGHFPGARVAHRIVGVNGAAGLQRLHVVGKVVGIDHRRQEIRLGRAVVGGNRYQFAIVQVPEAGAVDLVNVAGAAGDEFGGFEQELLAL